MNHCKKRKEKWDVIQYNNIGNEQICNQAVSIFRLLMHEHKHYWEQRGQGGVTGEWGGGRVVFGFSCNCQINQN